MVFLLGLRFGNYVVHVDLDLLVHHIVEQSYHSPLISCPGVLASKGHHLVTERSPQGDEGSLFHILRRHLYLIVTGEPIHEGKQSEIGCIIHEDIDVCRGKLSLGLTRFRSR